MFRYHDITKDDMKNGDGLRAVLWVAGCIHHCPGCHNPVTWDVDGGLLFDEAAKQELFEELAKPYISGVTFSGGDPLHPANRDDITELAMEIKEEFPGKTVWIYTGYMWKQVMCLPVMLYADVLVDGRFDMDKADVKLMWKGSSNQRVIDVQATIQAAERSGDLSVPVLHCGDYADDAAYSVPDARCTSCTT